MNLELWLIRPPGPDGLEKIMLPGANGCRVALISYVFRQTGEPE